MPPTFLVLLAIFAWLGIAGAVLFAALLLLTMRTTRRFSKPLALAMMGTLPFLLAYNFIAAIPVGAFLLTSWALWKLIEPGSQSSTNNPWLIGVSICAAFFAFGTLLVTSLAGLYDGFGTGWRWGQGQEIRSAVSQALVYRWASRKYQRRAQASLDRLHDLGT